MTPSFTSLAIEGLRSRTNPHCLPAPPAARRLLACLGPARAPARSAGRGDGHRGLGRRISSPARARSRTRISALAWPGTTPCLDATCSRRRSALLHHPGPSLLTVAEDERVETLRARLRTGRGAPATGTRSSASCPEPLQPAGTCWCRPGRSSATSPSLPCPDWKSWRSTPRRS